MPGLSEPEKDKIKEHLFSEGERLFLSYEIKKVTIDELAAANDIARASFYTFYENKESLNLNIAQNIQSQIFAELNVMPDINTRLSNIQRVRQIFAAMYEQMAKRPILSRIDNVTIELIPRKVSTERLSAFAKQNLNAAVILNKHGISFICSLIATSCAFQALYHGWLSLRDSEDSVRDETAGILLSGIIERIVVD